MKEEAFEDSENAKLEWEKLVDGLLNESLSPEEHERLQRLLKEDAAARRFYFEYLDIQESLEWEGAGKTLPDPLGLEEGARLEPSKMISLRRSTFRWGLAGMAALFAVTLLGLSFSNLGKDWRVGVEAWLGEDDFSIGRMVWLDDAVWEEGAFEVSEWVDAGWFRLASGAAEIELHNGAVIVLEGPASLRLDSEEGGFVERGALAVQVPPEATGFTLRTLEAKVVDLGTAFGMSVGLDGETNVHVLEGEVEVYAAEGHLESEAYLVQEQEAVRLSADNRKVESFVFDGERFEDLVSTTLHRRRALKLQFDCGSIAGLYRGVGAPAHDTGDFFAHEDFWNQIVGDQSGTFLMADGNPCPYPLRVDFGSGRKEIDWDRHSTKVKGGQGNTHGVFSNELGRDAFHDAGRVGIRIQGLPAGRYRVYLMGRSVIDTQHWGNFLVSNTHVASIGRNLSDLDSERLDFRKLKDPFAQNWIEGETHVVGEVEVTGLEDFLCMITRKDFARSDRGGQAAIQGFQLVQID